MHQPTNSESSRGQGASRIADFLRTKGIVDEEILQRAMTIHQEEIEHPRTRSTQRRRLWDILIDDLGADPHSVHRALSALYGFREIDLEPQTIRQDQLYDIRELFDSLSEEIRVQMIAARVIPFKDGALTNGHLQILAEDPTTPLIETLASRLGYRKYEVAYVRGEVLDELIERITQSENDFLQIIQEASEAEIIEEWDERIDEDALDAEINRSLLGSLIEGCLVEAVRKGASDIHVVPRQGNRTEFHFREDGKLHLWYTQEGTKPEAVSAVVKDRSMNVDRFERERAQDGFIQRRIDGYLIRFRVSVMPIVGQEYDRRLERIVIRVLDDRKMVVDLEELGFQGKARGAFLQSIRKPQGLVILTGPTGCGKSTTLVAALHHVMHPSLNVLTVEDPVEYMIPGAGQLKIDREKLSFEHALRAILRHDPDIVMVGEMRDLETAQIAIKLANTGHLTFSTLHTNDAPSAVSRLYKMGVEPFLIANAINIIVAQRLVPTLCPQCKRPVEDLDPSSALRLGFSEEEISSSTFYEAVGCEVCRLGYRGRVAIHEALLFTPAVRRLVLDAGDMVDEQSLREQGISDGMLTLRASGRERIKQGITTLEAVAAATTE